MVALEKILTLDNLMKRKLIVVDWCCMCKRSGESIDHHLLRCEVAREFWRVIFRLFIVEWVIMPRRVIKLLDCLLGQLGSRSNLADWRMSPLCLM
jgi:hypothetical protein